MGPREREEGYRWKYVEWQSYAEDGREDPWESKYTRTAHLQRWAESLWCESKEWVESRFRPLYCFHLSEESNDREEREEGYDSEEERYHREHLPCYVSHDREDILHVDEGDMRSRVREDPAFPCLSIRSIRGREVGLRSRAKRLGVKWKIEKRSESCLFTIANIRYSEGDTLPWEEELYTISEVDTESFRELIVDRHFIFREYGFPRSIRFGSGVVVILNSRVNSPLGFGSERCSARVRLFTLAIRARRIEYISPLHERYFSTFSRSLSRIFMA